jgi:hypothetical protein
VAGAKKVNVVLPMRRRVGEWQRRRRSLGNASLLEFYLRHVHQHVSLGLWRNPLFSFCLDFVSLQWNERKPLFCKNAGDRPLPNEGPILEVPCSIVSKRGVILLGRLGPWAMGHSNHVMALGKNHPLHLIYFGVLLEFSVKSHCLWVSFNAQTPLSVVSAK